MKYLSYNPKYKNQILEIFHSNCPKYFDVTDEIYLIEFLEKYADDNFLVIEKDGIVIGCGGHYTKADRHGITWTMFKRYVIGAKFFLNVADTLFSEIENRIKTEGKNLPIYINTTQVMERLFNRYGFVTYEKTSNGFGMGLDEYKMRKEI